MRYEKIKNPARNQTRIIDVGSKPKTEVPWQSILLFDYYYLNNS